MQKPLWHTIVVAIVVEDRLARQSLVVGSKGRFLRLAFLINFFACATPTDPTGVRAINCLFACSFVDKYTIHQSGRLRPFTMGQSVNICRLIFIVGGEM